MGVWSETKDKSKTLIHAQKIDAANEKLGQSIKTELQYKIIKQMHTGNNSLINKMLYEGLEYIDFNVKKNSSTNIYRAYADVSYYDDIQIKEVRDFLFKKVERLCKFKAMREMIFLLNLEINYLVLDKLNKPFVSFAINKEVCREIEPYGRYRAVSKRALRKLKNNK